MLECALYLIVVLIELSKKKKKEKRKKQKIFVQKFLLFFVKKEVKNRKKCFLGIKRKRRHARESKKRFFSIGFFSSLIFLEDEYKKAHKKEKINIQLFVKSEDSDQFKKQKICRCFDIFLLVESTGLRFYTKNQHRLFQIRQNHSTFQSCFS